MSKIVITGAGQVSPLGSNLKEFYTNLESGIKGIRNITAFNSDYFPTKFGGEAKSGSNVIKFDKEIDRKAEFIKSAVDELLSNNLEIDKYSPENRIAHFGAGIDYFDLEGYVDSQKYINAEWEEFCKRSTITAKEIAKKYKIAGGSSLNVSACVASTQALGLAFRILKTNPEKFLISGGFDSMLCHLHYLGFYKLGALSTWEGKAEEACRPYDKKRCGLVIGEGGVAYSLQSDEFAEKSNILAEIAGYSSTMDSYMPTDPNPEGEYLAKAGLSAIYQAGISPEDVDCVHVHGTGTFRNELAETQAMKRIFGELYNKIPVFSLKGHIGHLIGACGAMEILAVIHSIKNQVVLPTANFEYQDKEADLFVIKDEPYRTNIKNVLKLNAGFGGQNTAILIKKYE